MKFTCHTTYDQKALTVMAWAVRKTVRAKRSRMVRVWAWGIIGLLAVSVWLSWGNVWQTAANCAVLAALLLINWKEDALNGFFAKRKALPRLWLRNPSGNMIEFCLWLRLGNILFW